MMKKEISMSTKVKIHLWIFLVLYVLLSVTMMYYWKIIGIAVAFLMVTPAIMIMRWIREKLEK